MFKINFFVALLISLFSARTVFLEGNFEHYRKYKTEENAESEEYTELWGALPQVMSRMKTSSSAHKDDHSIEQIDPFEIMSELTVKLPLLLAMYSNTEDAPIAEDQSKHGDSVQLQSTEGNGDRLAPKEDGIRLETTEEHEPTQQDETTANSSEQDEDHFEHKEVDEEDEVYDLLEHNVNDTFGTNLLFSVQKTISDAQINENASKLLHSWLKSAKKCSTSPDIEAWCTGACKYAFYRRAFANVSIPWKPTYPAVTCADCGKYFYKMWNFGTPLGLNIFYLENNFVTGWNADYVASKLLETRRERIIEWHLHGIDPYNFSTFPENPECMVIIANSQLDSFLVQWSEGQNNFMIEKRRCGLLSQYWNFGTSVQIKITSLGNNLVFFENWQMGKTTMTYTDHITWERGEKDVESLKKYRRAIAKWCEENRGWLMLPCKIYRMSDEEVQSL